MRRLRFIIGAFLAVAWTAPLGAQQATGTVRGRVVDDASRQPLSGVSVTVGGRTALTQSDGQYLVSGVAAGAQTLRARFLGYAPATQAVAVSAGQVATADLGMTAQAIGLSEIVVTGYGEQRAGDITGAVTAVSAEEFNPGRIVSPAQLIQSKVAGVQVVDNNEPGGGLSIRVRGNTSINASSEPLYVVDGVPLGNGAGGGLSAGRDPLNFINPNDIENITVLRDASASAIYGSNAANGVVIITTRTGAGRTRPTFEYSSSFSAASIDRLPGIMNAAQYRAAMNANGNYVDSLGTANTNWFDQISQTGYGQDQNFSISSATSTMDYRLSLGYLTQTGVIQASETERFSLGLNYNQRLFNDRVTVRTNLRGSRTQDQFTPGDVLGNAAAMDPTHPVTDANSWTGTGYWDWNTTNAGPSNPVASLNLARDNGTTWRGLGTIRTDYRTPFIEGLSAKLNLSYDISRADRQSFNPNNLANQIKQNQGTLYLANNVQSIGTLEALLDYSPLRAFGPGTLTLVGGYSYSGSRSEYPSYTAFGLASNLLGQDGIAGARNVSNIKSIVDYKLISFFGRANYNIGDRYLATISYRRDGSSRFGPGNQWGNFPSVAAAWRLSQEPFMRGRWGLSDFKLRGSWARTGNQAFGDYLFVPSYTYSNDLARVQFGTQFITTIRPSAVDENIRWEQTDSYDVGVDYGFSGQRFYGTFDWYVRNTDDLIFTIDAAAGTTLSDRVTTNIGSMKNTGFEFSFNARLMEGRNRGLGWTTSFVASRNTNELKAIDPRYASARILTGGVSGGVGNYAQVLQPGFPVRSFYVLEQRYRNGRPVYTPGAGLFGDTAMYVDQPTLRDTTAAGCRGPNAATLRCVGDFRPDGRINDLDRRPYQQADPKWILGFSNYLTYGAFDASITLRANLGNYVYNNVASTLGAYQNITSTAMPTNLHESVLETGFETPQYYSDYFVEDASFLRLDNITIGYSFNYRGQPIRVFGTVQNALTITGYSGVDPTAGYNGLDNNIYPRSRTFTTGLNVRF